MARISKYQNNHSDTSSQKIENILNAISSINAKTIEDFQIKYGISDVLMSKSVGLDPSAISRYKAGIRNLSDTTLIALYFVMQEFSKQE